VNVLDTILTIIGRLLKDDEHSVVASWRHNQVPGMPPTMRGVVCPLIRRGGNPIPTQKGERIAHGHSNRDRPGGPVTRWLGAGSTATDDNHAHHRQQRNYGGHMKHKQTL